MSIIYKGLNPKHDYGLCILTINGELITANGKHFQAIQIPTPHGRLIDAKVFADTICQAIQSGDLIQKSIWEWIADASTILEAEE